MALLPKYHLTQKCTRLQFQLPLEKPAASHPKSEILPPSWRLLAGSQKETATLELTGLARLLWHTDCFPRKTLVPALRACWRLGLSPTHSQGFQAQRGLQEQQQRLRSHLGGTQVSASIGKTSLSSPLTLPELCSESKPRALMVAVLLAGASTSAGSKRSRSGAQLLSALSCSRPGRRNVDDNPAALVADRCHQKGLPLSRPACCSPLRAAPVPEGGRSLELLARVLQHQRSLFPEPLLQAPHLDGLSNLQVCVPAPGLLCSWGHTSTAWPLPCSAGAAGSYVSPAESGWARGRSAPAPLLLS